MFTVVHSCSRLLAVVHSCSRLFTPETGPHSCGRCSRMNRAHKCERCAQLCTVAHSCPRLSTAETGPQSRDAMKHAPHHTTCELRWQCRARSCCKCNRARSLPGAAGPVRPAANSHGRALHKKHSTSKLAVELSAAGCCRCLQLAGRHYEPQPNRYESRHHDALPSTSLQRVHAAAVRPK